MVVLGTLLLLMVSPGVQAQEATLGQALQHYYRGDYPAAVDVLKSITDRDPENAAAYYYLGYTYQEMGNFGEPLMVTGEQVWPWTRRRSTRARPSRGELRS
jgi:predicted Zn-dependent protease